MKYIFRILKFAAELKYYYLVIGVLTILTSLLGLAIPAVSGWAIDEIRRGTSANIKLLIGFAVIIFLCDLLSNVFNNINGYFGDQVNAKLYKILSYKYYDHLLKLDQNFFDTELSGKIINRLNRSVVQITNFIQSFTNNFLQFVFGTIFALVIVAIYSWQVALLLFILYPIYIWLTFKSSDRWQKYQEKKNKYSDIATGRFVEGVNQIKVIKGFIQEARELNFFNSNLKKVVKINKPQSVYWHKRDFVRRLTLNIIFFLVYLYIFYEGAHGVFSPGAAVALILYSMQIRIPIFTISFLVDSTQRAIADSKDYFEVMNIKPSTDDREKPNIKVRKGDIVFKDVDFSYSKKRILKGVSFDIEPNSKVALVGESGVGKTTITNLLMKLYEPSQGAISIDNQDIDDYNQNSIRNKIGVVFQDPSLFSGTIRENISYSRPNASNKDVENAAKAANAHEFISKLENGYDSEIGERGIKLSGGQKQRIAIARALLKDPRILILDEATSSLDSKSEMLVQEALKELMKNRTTIIVAHRLSTIAHVDKIITLKDGRVDEIGSPAELAKTDGIYAELLKLQNASTKEEKDKLKSYDISLGK